MTQPHYILHFDGMWWRVMRMDLPEPIAVVTTSDAVAARAAFKLIARPN